MLRQNEYARSVKEKNSKERIHRKPPAVPKPKEQDDIISRRTLVCGHFQMHHCFLDKFKIVMLCYNVVHSLTPICLSMLAYQPKLVFYSKESSFSVIAQVISILISLTLSIFRQQNMPKMCQNQQLNPSPLLTIHTTLLPSCLPLPRTQVEANSRILFLNHQWRCLTWKGYTRDTKRINAVLSK